MANPFLVLGGIAVGIVTATFGILQVPGWVASAQDASAKNDISQISIAQAASLSTLGVAQPTLILLNDDTLKIGVKVTTQLQGGRVYIDTSTDNKNHLVIVRSQSGNYFARYNNGPIATATEATYANATTGLAAQLGLGTPPAGIAIPAETTFPD